MPIGFVVVLLVNDSELTLQLWNQFRQIHVAPRLLPETLGPRT